MRNSRDNVEHLLSWARGAPAPPRRLFWVMTERCNLSCPMCGFSERGAADRPAELSGEEMLGVAEQVAALGVRETYLVGGEVFVLGRTLERVTEALKGRGVQGELSTNGTSLTRRAVEHLVAIGWDDLTVSLDAADAATHDRQRGRPGVFAEAVAGIQALNEAKVRHGAEHPRLKLHCVLQQSNIDHLAAFLELAQTLQPTLVCFEPMSPQTEFATEQMLTPAALPQARRQLRQAARYADELRLGHNIDALLRDDWIQEAAHLDRILRKDVAALDPGFFAAGCLVFWDQLVVLADGSVGPCFRHRPTDLPRVQETDLEQIWYGEAMARVRARVAAGELPAECAACCMTVAVDNRQQRIVGLYHLGEHEQVVRFCRQIDLLESPSLVALWHLLRALLDLGRRDEALQTLRQLVTDKHFKELAQLFQETRSAGWLADLSGELLAQPQPWLRGLSLQQWHEREPRLPPRLTAYKLRDLVELAVQLEALPLSWALALAGTPDPEDRTAVWQHAAALEQADRCHAALALLERLEPRSGALTAAILDLRGRLLCRLGRHAEAEADLRATLELEPERVETTCALSYCLYRLGRVESARAAARRSLALEENPLSQYLLDLYRQPPEEGAAMRPPPNLGRLLRDAAGSWISTSFLDPPADSHSENGTG